MLVLLVGTFLGLVFLLGGLSGALTRFLAGMQAMRLSRGGIAVDAEVLRSRVADDGSGSDLTITAQWQVAGAFYKQDFVVPRKVREEQGGTTMPLLVDPNRPQVAVSARGSMSPIWQLALAIVWMVMAVVGGYFMVRSMTMACDQTPYESLRPLCEWLPVGVP